MNNRNAARLLILAGCLGLVGLGLFAQWGQVEEREAVLLEQKIVMYEGQDCLFMKTRNSEDGEIINYVFPGEQVREDLQPGSKIKIRIRYSIDNPCGVVQGVSATG